jgi:hypothetical protein
MDASFSQVYNEYSQLLNLPVVPNYICKDSVWSEELIEIKFLHAGIRYNSHIVVDARLDHVYDHVAHFLFYHHYRHIYSKILIAKMKVYR